jgi:hypothetical protein
VGLHLNSNGLMWVLGHADPCISSLTKNLQHELLHVSLALEYCALCVTEAGNEQIKGTRSRPIKVEATKTNKNKRVCI